MKVRLLGLFVGAAYCLMFPAGASEVWDSAEFQCGIVLPTNWVRVPPPAAVVKVASRSADKTKSLSVLIIPLKDVEFKSEEDFVARFRKQWFGHGTGRGQVEEKVTVAGRTGWLLKDIAMLGGKEMHRANTLFFKDGNLYQVDAMSRESDPLSDPAIKESVASFHFLSEKKPVGTTSGNMAPRSVLSKRSESGRVKAGDDLAGTIGGITAYVLMGIVAIFFIVKVLRGR
jgi:hypothetical protein